MRAAALALGAVLALGIAAPQAAAQDNISAANKFNRLMKKVIDTNAPPMTDGIHDPENPGTEALQPPKEAFAGMPKGMSGNRVDWVKALRDGAIDPRADRENPDAKKQVMDLDIIREVKGSMPDVVYPHKPHTEWLDCAQCHPKIFVPKKGGNPISMAAILMGQYCGVCHGKVAFPVSECSKCHSKPKKNPAAAAVAATAAGASSLSPISTANAAPPKTGVEAKALVELSRDDLMTKGAQVYADTCAGCHGENGEGVPDTFPAIKGSKVALGPPKKHIETVLKGVADTAMTPWADSLSDEDVAAVISFQRNSWGNKADIVQPAAVKALR